MSERVQRLHESSWQGVIYLTGGGSLLLSDLLSVPGASNTLLEASVPYAQQALQQLLGSAPEQAASQSTGRALSMRAYHRALELGSDQAFGIGLTASLSSNTPKRGQTRAHWAIQTSTQSTSFELTLDNAEPRSLQEQQLNDALWASIENILLGDAANDSMRAQLHRHAAPEAWLPLLDAAPYATCTQAHDGKLILPGSFNPVHPGHREMLAVAENLTGLRGAFELTLRNADKPDLDYLTVQERLQPLTDTPVWLTNLTNFEQKTERFNNATFVLGTDTLTRIAEPRFYGDDQERMLRAIDNIALQGTKFLVFGRLSNGNFNELSDLDLPETLNSICQAVPSEIYRNDISSSAIRKQSEKLGKL